MLYTIFDIETTGFYESTCDVIQFAYLRLNENFKYVDSGVMHFYYPGMHWSKEAENVHHISMSYLKQFENEFENNLKKMYIMLARCNAVTFNGNTFDIPFCRTWLQRMGMPYLDVTCSYDLMKILRPVYGKNIKLASLPERLDIPEEVLDTLCTQWFGNAKGAHDAGYDVTMTAVGFMNAVNNNYVEKPKAPSTKSNVKDSYEESDFSSLACYRVHDVSLDKEFILNLCSAKGQFGYFEIPVADVPKVCETKHFNGILLPTNFLKNVMRASEASITFAGSKGIYTAEICPGVIGKITSTTSLCSFSTE